MKNNERRNFNGWYENSGFFYPGSPLNVKGYFSVELKKKDIPIFLEEFFKLANEKFIFLDFAITFPWLQEPYAKYFSSNELSSSLNVKIKDYEVRLPVSRIKEFIENLWKNFGIRGFFMKSKNFYIRVCDGLTIEIIDRRKINEEIEKILKSLIKKTRPQIKLPIEGRIRKYKKLLKVECRETAIPYLIYEVLSRLRKRKCAIDLKMPFKWEINYSYLISLEELGIKPTDEVLNSEFEVLGAKFKDFKTILDLDKAFKVFKVLDSNDYRVYTSNLMIVVFNSRLEVHFFTDSLKERSKLESILKKILTNRLPSNWVRFKIKEDEMKYEE
jgi:hypothetical protein